ncbi:MAG: carbohydrate kinase family protein [archaeon]
MKYDVVTFGSGLVDSFIETGLSEKNRSMCYPAGSKILVKGVRSDVGGGGTNTAVAFSRFGLKTGCICGIGNDLNGLQILACLKTEGVKFLGKKKKGQSGYSVVLDSNQHNRTILTYKGVNNNLTTNDIKWFRTKWLYLSSLLGQSLQTQKQLADKLMRKGTKLAFNPSEYLIKRHNLKPILRLCDAVVMNKEEAAMLVGKKEKDLLKGINSLGPKIVVITDKNNLIKAFDGKKKYFLRPNKIKVVERTGAGDAFASSFVAGQIAGKTIEDSLKLALKNSESVIRHFGAKNKLLREGLK